MSSPTEEKHLPLPNNRTLAYTHSGNPQSRTLVIFFHGVFGVGDAFTSPALLERNIHFVAPTLAGWGTSSPRPTSTPYHVQLGRDITVLIDQLYQDKSGLEIYVAGGSYGTVPAQMLYGASEDIFPAAKYIRGCLLIAAFSPPRYHKSYTAELSTQSYISIGPPSRLPFRILQRLAVPIIKRQLTSPETAEAFLRKLHFDPMDEEEKIQFKKWQDERGEEDGAFVRRMAANMIKSVEKTPSGFLEVSDVLHSDWGFHPAHLKQSAPIIIVCSKGDEMATEGMAKWLDSQYVNSKLITVDGGHLAGVYDVDRILSELIDSTRGVVSN